MLLKSVLVLLPLISTSSSTTLEEEKELVGVGKEGVKKPKLFYVSTLSTTSTVSTLTVCYVTSATLATCTAGKRRKRRMVELDQPEETILPTSLWGKSYCRRFYFFYNLSIICLAVYENTAATTNWRKSTQGRTSPWREEKRKGREVLSGRQGSSSTGWPPQGSFEFIYYFSTTTR